jgi:hypothetical protein
MASLNKNKSQSLTYRRRTLSSMARRTVSLGRPIRLGREKRDERQDQGAGESGGTASMLLAAEGGSEANT